MKIGYTTSKENIMFLEQTCDKVYYFKKNEVTPQSFYKFVKKNRGNVLVVKNIEDIGLQLVQMLPALEKLATQEEELLFLEKKFASALTNQNFNRLLLSYAKNEQDIMSYRTIEGIQKAKKEGVKYGRPKINQEVIARIQYLGTNQEWSVREIAEMCEVSIGTVHKYLSNEQ